MKGTPYVIIWRFISAGVSGNFQVNSNGQASGSLSGNVGLGPVNLNGNLNVANGKVSGGANVGVNAGPVSLNGKVQVNPNGQVSGGASGSLNAGPVSANGNINVGSNGQVSGGASGSLNAGPVNVNGNVQVNQNGQASGGLSGSVSGSAGSLSGNVQVNPNGQASGSASGSLGSGGSSGASSSGNSGTPIDTSKIQPGRKFSFFHPLKIQETRIFTKCCFARYSTLAWKASLQTKQIKTSKTFEPPHDKTNKVAARHAKIQISLGVRPVWSESSLCA